jgi:radical SAM superfamily enzyme YgiQ (UPF0313 family)
MNFNFIIPSWSYWEEPTRAQPLTQLYLATILENEGHKVEFTDFRDGLKQPNKTDAYLYTIASPDIKEVEEIIKGIRKRFPFSIHIGGGPHVNIFPEESKEIFDSCVLGSGEESIKHVGRDLETGKLRRTYQIPIGKDYPFPKRHFLPKDKIVTSLFKTENIPSTTVLFAHGCPFYCAFCANYNRQPIRQRSLESVSDEIDYLKNEYGIKGLSLQDEICFPKDDPTAFLGLLESKGIVWRGQTRAGVSIDKLERSKQSGCLELSIGLESVDQSVINLMRKGIKVDMVRQTLRDCKKVGINTRLYLLNGLPGEPKDIVKRTKEFIEQENPDFVLLSTLQPYPGSDIYNHPENYGIKWIDKDFTKYNHLRCRFADSKDRLNEAVPFEYEQGRGFTRQEIMDNLINLQTYLRERGLNK